MRFAFIIVSIFSFLNSMEIDNSFITKKEYGSLLYENPRGIGCNKCHGDNAKGTLIARYEYKDKKTKKYVQAELRAPSITEIDYKTFKNKLTKKNTSKVMPTYFLTNQELESIYHYIKNIDKN